MAIAPPTYLLIEATPSFPAAVGSPPLLPCSSALTTQRQLKYERERRSRKHRVEKKAQMHAYVASLERTAVAIRVVPDADSIWDEFLDDDTKRTRARLRRLIPVAEEVKQLLDEKAQLQLLLTERELMRRSVARLANSMEVSDPWAASCAKWKALTRIHSQPLTSNQCITLMNTALEDMQQFVLCHDKESSGLSFMGWRDQRRLLPSESSLQFSLDKSYQGYDLKHHIEMMWRVYSEPQLYSKVVLGGRARVSIDILQQLSPTAWVVHIAESYDGTEATIHNLYLLFRVKTDDGAIQCLRSIEDTDLQRAINTPSDLWTTNYFWMRWEVLDPLKDWTSTDYRVSVGGCLHGEDPAYLHRWLFELVAVLVRSEGVVTGRLMLDFSS